MGVDDGAEFRRGLEAGHEFRRHHRRHGENHGIVADRQPVLAEVERRDPILLEIQRAQPASELDPHVALAKKAQRGRDESGVESFVGNQRPACLSPGCQRLADDCAGEARARLHRIGIERRDPERPRKALVERSRA